MFLSIHEATFLIWVLCYLVRDWKFLFMDDDTQPCHCDIFAAHKLWKSALNVTNGPFNRTWGVINWGCSPRTMRSSLRYLCRVQREDRATAIPWHPWGSSVSLLCIRCLLLLLIRPAEGTVHKQERKRDRGGWGGGGGDRAKFCECD